VRGTVIIELGIGYEEEKHRDLLRRRHQNKNSFYLVLTKKE